MSFYDDASLVVIPSGFKTSKVYAEKPTDGSGDLAYTRTGDTATRVNSAGIIEKVRTNLVLQSNTFSTTWANDDSTETSGQTGYDGTTNAWLLAKTAANGRIGQVLTVSGSVTFSIYAKAGTDSWVRLASSDAGVNAYFNLGTGAVGSTGANTTAAITSVGNGWYRCSISGNASFTFFNVWVADANNDTSGTSGNILIQAAQIETGDVATPYIPTTTAAVSVGPVANVPRLDYLGSTCPRLLLEPQRINLKTYSEDFSTAAGWTSSTAGGATVTRTANYGISPDGYQNADRLQLALNGGSYADYLSANTITNGTTYTYSIYVKSLSGTVSFYFLGGTPSGNILKTATTEWTRITHTFTASSTIAYPRFLIEAGASSSVDLLIWGAQLEAGAYATSYIPTLAASATRGADACSKTGISSLIGQTEGAFYCEVDMQNLDKNLQPLLELNQDANNRIGIGAFWDSFLSVNRMQLYQFFAGSLEVNIQETIISGVLKVAAAYKANDYVLYINGVQIGTDTSASVPATSTIYLGSNASTFFVGNGVKQTILFKTRLTNAELATLTTL